MYMCVCDVCDVGGIWVAFGLWVLDGVGLGGFGSEGFGKMVLQELEVPC